MDGGFDEILWVCALTENSVSPVKMAMGSKCELRNQRFRPELGLFQPGGKGLRVAELAELEFLAKGNLRWPELGLFQPPPWMGPKCALRNERSDKGYVEAIGS